jgi:hypothetical protein
MIKRFYGQGGPQTFKPFNLMAFIHIRIPSQLLRESSDTRKRSLAATWMNGRLGAEMKCGREFAASHPRMGRDTAKW